MSKNDFHNESQEIWDKLGPWWDKNVEDGDYFHRAFVFPAIEKLLELRGGELILDAGCGNGALSRRMASNGAQVIGIDFSRSLIEQARKRSPNIKYMEMSLTDKDSLLELSKKRKFDHIVCSMVLHDVSDITPFFHSLPDLLEPKGSFIFSIPHPCFNSPAVEFQPEGSITIRNYIQQTTSKLRSKPGQPIEQLVFHRPLCDYFNLLFAQGMFLNGFEEPCVNPNTLPEGSLWAERSTIPPAIICRWVFK